MANTPRLLTEAQIEQFMTKGYVTVHDCLDLDIANRWIQEAYEHHGIDPADPGTWHTPLIQMTHIEHYADIRTFAPRMWDACCDLLVEDRIDVPCLITSRFIINLCNGADRPWEPPSPNLRGWHKDGNFFRHFLDSPEQALLSIVLWNDVAHQGGGTFMATDSIPVVARYLAEHPEGCDPNAFGQLIHECREFEEVTGKAGDVCLMHPFMLHASSQNVLRRPRMATNPPVQLREPMDLNRQDPGEFSVLERATLRGLGVERYDFRPAGSRLRWIGRDRGQVESPEESRQRRLALITD